jgi:ABC-2 type transport system ATP-binding protein
MDTPGLRVDDLSKRYGNRFALQSLSFHAHPGEVLGILGPNGAGKSTTFLSLNGLLRPDSGTISLDGRSLGRNRGQSIALIPETPDVVPMLTVWEHLIYAAKLSRLPQGWETRAHDLLERLGLAAERNTLGHALSKGLRQKTLIAATVLIDAPVLMLDEPMIGLDPHAQRELREMLNELKSRGRVVLISTHMLSIAEHICDRLLILKSGKKIAEGKPHELRENFAGSLEELFLEMTEDAIGSVQISV